MAVEGVAQGALAVAAVAGILLLKLWPRGTYRWHNDEREDRDAWLLRFLAMVAAAALVVAGFASLVA